MTHIDWNDGRLITLTPGDTATASGALDTHQLYGLFFCATPNDADAIVDVVWSASRPPATVIVPGTTAHHGLASVLFVSGNDTHTVSAALRPSQPGARVQCFLGSVKMPSNPAGMHDQQLAVNGELHPFQGVTRYHTVVQNPWYAGMIRSNVHQFIAVQFSEQLAKVYVVNATSDPSLQVQAVGQAAGRYQIEASATQIVSWYLQGNGTQLAWFNAEGVRSAQTAGMSLQSLSALYDRHTA